MSTRIAVVGMGKSGQAACLLAQHHGAQVLTVDSRNDAVKMPNAHYCHGEDPCDLLAECDQIILSPGVPLAHPMLDKAKLSAPSSDE